MSDSHPAVLGGRPAFPEKIQIVRPVLPAFSALEGEARQVLASGMVTKGTHLRRFENAVAEHLGVNHAVGVSSCTTGLMLTYQGLGLTGEVVVPSFTFMATVSALVWAGLRPVFADVEAGSTNLSPAAVEAAITGRTSAIVAVHNFGNPAEIDELQDLAQRHGLKLVFDAAHGFGSLYRGQPVGRQGDAQVFSLSPTKLLITGEGGIVATNDDDLAERIRTGREYGNSGAYDSAFAGFNARMPELNALMGIHSLGMLEEAARRRNETAALFHAGIGSAPGIGFQEIHPLDRCSYKDFSLTVEAGAFGLTRDELAEALSAENIDTRRYYYPPVHCQTAYTRYFDGQALPNTQWLAAHSLSLPIWSHMPAETAVRIGDAVHKIHEHAVQIHAHLSDR